MQPLGDAHDITLSIVAPLRDFPLRIRPASPLTDDALFELCRVNGALRIERTANGEILVMPPTGGETGRRNAALTAAVVVWAAQDGSGVAFDSNTGWILPNGAERAPDVSWIEKHRWHALTPQQRERFVPLCPDFVIELRSPSDDIEELHAKMREYRENGARLGWLLDPETRSVWIYEHGKSDPERLDQPETVSGEPLLRAFGLHLAAIW